MCIIKVLYLQLDSPYIFPVFFSETYREPRVCDSSSSGGNKKECRHHWFRLNCWYHRRSTVKLEVVVFSDVITRLDASDYLESALTKEVVKKRLRVDHTVNCSRGPKPFPCLQSARLTDHADDGPRTEVELLTLENVIAYNRYLISLHLLTI